QSYFARPWLQRLHVPSADPNSDVKRVIALESSVNAVSHVKQGNRTFVLATCDENLHLYSIDTGELLRTLPGHAIHATSVAVTGDGQTAVSGAGDGMVRVWDLTTGSHRVLRGQGQSSGVVDVAVSADGRVAASVSHYEPVWVWDLTTGSHRVLPGLT